MATLLEALWRLATTRDVNKMSRLIEAGVSCRLVATVDHRGEGNRNLNDRFSDHSITIVYFRTATVETTILDIFNFKCHLRFRLTYPLPPSSIPSLYPPSHIPLPYSMAAQQVPTGSSNARSFVMRALSSMCHSDQSEWSWTRCDWLGSRRTAYGHVNECCSKDVQLKKVQPSFNTFFLFFFSTHHRQQIPYTHWQLYNIEPCDCERILLLH